MIEKIKVEIAERKKNFLREEYYVLKDITKSVAMPIIDNETLDETLDTTQIIIYNKQQDPFMPFTRFIITLYEEGKEHRIYRYLDSDDVEQRTFGKNPIFCHKINLIEITKILEKEPIGNLSFTNYLDLYLDNPVASWGINVIRNKRFNYKYCVYLNEKRFAKVIQAGDIVDLGVRMTIMYGSAMGGSQALKYLKTAIVFPDGTEHEIKENSFKATRNGNYSIKQYYYYGNYNDQYDPKVIYLYISWSFKVVPDKQKINNVKYTILEVINRLLRVGQTLQKHKQQKYILDTNLNNRLKGIESPELNFTNLTLFEALCEIGGIIHAIPRLIPSITVSENGEEDYYSNWNVITFDFLGEEIIAEKKFNSLTETSITSNNFTNGFVTNVQNGLMSIYNSNATITEPFDRGFLSLRTETGNLEITNDNFCLKTLFPIGAVKKLLICYKGMSYDCTEFLVEKAVYDTFKTYDSGAIIESKFGYLYYTRGQCNIRGADTQRLNSNFISNVLNEYKNSLHFILKRKANIIDSNDFVGKDFTYNLEYVPYMNFLVKQKKCIFKQPMPEIYDYYNQTTNIVDIEALGENVRGTLLRTGNTDFKETVYFKNFNQTNILGQITNKNYYCFCLAKELMIKSPIKVTISWSKDYNKLSEYIGYKKAIREYEISENECFDRTIDYGEYLIISDKFDLGEYFDPGTLDIKSIDSKIKEKIEDYFSECKISSKKYVQTAYDNWLNLQNRDDLKISCAIIKTYNSGDSNPIASFCLPVMSFNYGNSAVFLIKTTDNYSAATSVSTQNNGGLSGIIEDYIPYGDERGRFDELEVCFKQSPKVKNESSYSMTLYRAEDIDDVETDKLIDFGDDPFIVDKDSRESISFMAQISACTDCENIKFYRSIAQIFPYLNSSNSIKYVTFKKVPPANADIVSDLIDKELDVSKSKINLNIRTICTPTQLKIPSKCCGVGLVSGDNNLLLYRNGQLNAGEDAPIFYFMFRKNI